MTLQEILGKIVFTATEVPARDDKLMSGTPMYHFHCMISYAGKEYWFYYSQGLAHNTGKIRKSLGGPKRIPMLLKDPMIGKNDTRFLESARGKPCPINHLIGMMERRLYDQHKFADLVYDPTPPTLPAVLTSLLLDARVGQMTFEEFCDEFGDDRDSRKAYAGWQACQNAMHALVRLFGYETVAFLSENTEALENYDEVQSH